MSEPISLSHTHQPPLRTQHPKQLLGHRIGTAVMSHLQDVYVAECPIPCERPQHALLGITGEQGTKPRALNLKNHTGLVCCSIRNVRSGPYARQHEPPHAQHIPSSDLAYVLRPNKIRGLRHQGRGLRGRSRRNAHY
jgi:hypothetical protein